MVSSGRPLFFSLWLTRAEPLTYAKLVFAGKLEQYARDMTGTHGMID